MLEKKDFSSLTYLTHEVAKKSLKKIKFFFEGISEFIKLKKTAFIFHENYFFLTYRFLKFYLILLNFNIYKNIE